MEIVLFYSGYLTHCVHAQPCTMLWKKEQQYCLEQAVILVSLLHDEGLIGPDLILTRFAVVLHAFFVVDLRFSEKRRGDLCCD